MSIKRRDVFRAQEKTTCCSFLGHEIRELAIPNLMVSWLPNKELDTIRNLIYNMAY